jgi:hypothetical protein
MSNTGEEPPKEGGSNASGCFFIVALLFGMVALFAGLTASANTQGWGNVGSAVIFQLTFPITIICLIIGFIAKASKKSE